MNRIYIFIITFLIFNVTSIAQAQVDPNDLIAQLSDKMNQVNSYEADVLIKVDVDFINIKEREAKVTYTKPDKFDIKVKGFTLLPKKGADMEYMTVLKENHTAIYEKDEMVDGINTSVLKVIPINSESDVILAQMWIDKESLRIIKMHTFTKENGTYTLSFGYANHPFDLPDSINVSFDIKNMMIPPSMTGDFEAFTEQITDESTEGKVTLVYSNYVVN